MDVSGEDYEGARKYYRKTLELSPRGFFTAITALDTLEKEHKGELPTGAYLAYLALEWMQDEAEKARAVRQLVKQLPQFAPGWKELATIEDEDREKLAAIEQGLAASPDAETRGLLIINKAMILQTQGDRDGASLMLRELSQDPALPSLIEGWTKTLLAMSSRSESSSPGSTKSRLQ